MNFQQQQKYVDAILPEAMKVGCESISVHWRIGVPGTQIWVWREKENWVAFNQSKHSYHYSSSLRLAISLAKEDRHIKPEPELPEILMQEVEF